MKEFFREHTLFFGFAHVVCACIVLITIFFTLGIRTEQSIITDQISRIVDKVHFYSKSLLSTDQQQKVSQKIDSLREDNSETLEINNNKKIEHTVRMIVALLIIILIGCSIYINKIYQLPYSQILKHIFINIVSVGTVEFLFLELVVKRYKTIDSNFIEQIFLSKLID